MSRRPGATQLLAAATLACVLPTSACKRGPEIPDTGSAYTEVGVEQLVSHMNGPPVRLESGGPSRFVHALYDRFRVDRTMQHVAFMDGLIRNPGTEGFDVALEHIADDLREAGFGRVERLELFEYDSEADDPAWLQKRARLTLVLPGGDERLLHEFSEPSDRDRLMLPVHAPSCDITGPVSFGLENIDAGEILVTRTSIRPDLINRARSRGAIGIVSASLGSYNVDPTGRERHLDAIQHRVVPSGTDLAMAQISERSFAIIEEEMLRNGSVSLHLTAETETGDKTVRTLVALVEGAQAPGEVVTLMSHVMDPGASDNASGAAGQLETALALVGLLQEGHLDWPARSVAFVWGMEYEESETWLERSARTQVAAVNAVMVGCSRAETGAIPLLERYPDPGATNTLPPDRHTLWGAREVEDEWLERPNGMSVIARCALADVGLHAGGWETSENPYEGGTDHDNFIKAGVPVVLLWHFTDFTFHTSLDRLEMVDGEEMRRMSVAAAATALAVADPRPSDLDRYIKSNRDEMYVRVAAAEEAADEELAESWREWCTGVRHWFRELCLAPE